MSINPNTLGKAVIEDGYITIRIKIKHLPVIVEQASLNLMYKVTDPAILAEDIVYELNREEEDGTTVIHRMFDNAIDEAYDQGSEGLVEVDES